jgi:crotonobetainyl-CoA:carnitine CoA-transferase CaiB-like acyl-CoA transferase
MKDKENIYDEIGMLTKNYYTKEFHEICLSLNLSASPVNSIKDVAELEFVKNAAVKTILPNGKLALLSPPSQKTDFLKENNFLLNCSPRLGEHNHTILNECGLSEDEVRKLITDKLI